MGAFLFIDTNMPKVFRKKWFWVGVILLFIFAIIWDISIAAAVLITSLSSGQWSITLLGLGLLYTTAVLYHKYLPSENKKQVKTAGRLILLVIAVLTFIDYGFFKTLYFLATVIIFSRLMKWIVGLSTRIVKRRRQPQFRAY